MALSFLAVAGAAEALGKVVLIDLVLAGDNAIIIGALAAGLPHAERRKVIMVGMAAALVLRVLFALVAVWLLNIVGLRLAGGLLLLWVCWKMYRELKPAPVMTTDHPHAHKAAPLKAKTFWGAVQGVVIADVSMSLDNVLAVAGAAYDHVEIMVFGLVLSVALMGIAANYIAGLIDRFRWIGWIGLGLVLYVAVEMIIGGGQDVLPLVDPLVDSILAP